MAKKIKKIKTRNELLSEQSIKTVLLRKEKYTKSVAYIFEKLTIFNVLTLLTEEEYRQSKFNELTKGVLLREFKDLFLVEYEYTITHESVVKLANEFVDMDIMKIMGE